VTENFKPTDEKTNHFIRKKIKRKPGTGTKTETKGMKGPHKKKNRRSNLTKGA